MYQVKWNKVTNNLFATTHEGDVRIWDPRVSFLMVRHNKLIFKSWAQQVNDLLKVDGRAVDGWIYIIARGQFGFCDKWNCYRILEKKILCLPWWSLLYWRSFLGVWATDENRWNIRIIYGVLMTFSERQYSSSVYTCSFFQDLWLRLESKQWISSCHS